MKRVTGTGAKTCGPKLEVVGHQASQQGEFVATSHRYPASTPYSRVLTGRRPKARTRASRISNTTPAGGQTEFERHKTAPVTVDNGIHQGIGLLRAMTEQRQRDQRIHHTQDQDQQRCGEQLRGIPVGDRDAGVALPAGARAGAA